MALRFDDRTPNAKIRLMTRFLNWAFRPPPPAGSATGGRGPRPRAIAGHNNNWLPIIVPNGIMATGAEGIVHLWCQVDPATLLIRDRVVVKEVVSGSQRYLDPNNWLNASVGGEPLECHQANVVWSATAPANQQHIQDCLGWGAVLPTTAPQQTYRYKLYHEYCAHANLSKVMKNQPKRKKKGAARKGKRPLPEPFLWYMFESLAKACEGMDAAYASNGVVHQDLHPGNVFFDTPNAARFSKYPVLKVADFGSARRIDAQVALRQGPVSNDPVCEPYAAAECAWFYNAQNVMLWEAPNMVISQRTNIYQVGLIMASAMRLVNPLPENNWRRPPRGYRIPPANQLHHDGANAPAIGVHELSRAQLNPGPKRYSARLIQLVWQCLRHDHTLRPTSAQLLQDIQTWANFQGMDTAVDPLTAAQTQLCIDLDKARYAVGSRW